MAGISAFRKAQRPQGPATIMAIGTANPPNLYEQSTFPDFYFRVTNSDHMPELKEKFRRICGKTMIKKRYMHLTEEVLNQKPGMCSYMDPSFDERQEIVVEEVPRLAKEAAAKAIEEWGRDKSGITHLVFCSTSGIDMPGADYRLVKLLDLPLSVNRIMLYNQACHIGAQMLRIAKDIAENNKDARVLAVACELNTLIFRGPDERDFLSLAGQAAFADGAAAVIVGADPIQGVEKPIFEMMSAAQVTVPDCERAVGGHLKEIGLTFHFMNQLPMLISNNLENCLLEAFKPLGITDWNEVFWVSHPGNWGIMDAIEKKFAKSSLAVTAGSRPSPRIAKMVSNDAIRKAQRPQGPATIMAIGTANPPNLYEQSTFPDFYFRVTNSDHMPELKEKFRRICGKTMIKKRYMHLTEEVLEQKPGMCSYMDPSFDERQEIVVEEVPRLAKEAAAKAIEEWGRDKSGITHLVFCSTSGIDMPGADYRLVKLLGLPLSVNRIMLYNQACHIGAQMLRIAKDIAENNKDARVLVVACELNTLIFRGPDERDFLSLAGQAAFADGAAAVIVGADPIQGVEKPIFEMMSAAQVTVPDCERAVGGHLKEIGLTFHFMNQLPMLISNNLENCLLEAFKPLGITDWNEVFWVSHPGNWGIMDAIEKKVGLKQEKLRSSRHVFGEYGNMMSATVLFVMDDVRRRSAAEGRATTGDGLDWGVLFGFGPGLSIETVMANVHPFRKAQRARGPATIMAIGTANPPNLYEQSTFPDFYFRVTNSDHMPELKEKFRRICGKTMIKKRYMHLTEEVLKDKPGMCSYMDPSLDERQDIVVEEVPRLAKEAAAKAIKEWGRDKSDVTHLVFCSTSGVDMPGADYRLVKLLGLPLSVNRIMLYNQACHIGAQILRIAKDIAENNKDARVLVVACELNTLIFRGPDERDFLSLAGQAAFADGAAAVIVGADPIQGVEKPIFEMMSAAQVTVPDCERAVGGHLKEIGLTFHFMNQLPMLISNNLENCLLEAFKPLGITDWNEVFWVSHPGNWGIMDAIERKVGLKQEKLRSSRHVFGEYGNMMSATVLFVMDDVRKRSAAEGRATTGDGLEWGVLFGFGPGLSIETVVLRSVAL
ncbi:hypothetical protein C4D60_Mb10t09840 [Musa balbisiana]|uniref:Chalcone synthase n=1 Tax=Musa balbisiana TaxID=52838 RepID=A0A4S8IW02_MUSBA|nr:hypothetical protein C4D60_Mb10t09840 [Musa balbisiana]